MTREIPQPYWNYTDPREYLRRFGRGLPEIPPVIITVAITGGVQGKEANPSLPETPEEQAESTYEAWNAGASIVHIHARRPDNLGMTSHDTDRYYEVNSLVRQKCPDIIINNTMAGDVTDSPDGHDHFVPASLYANPEIVALDCGPVAMKFTLKERLDGSRKEDVEFDDIFFTTHAELLKYADLMKLNRIKPEFELYNAGQYTLLDYIIANGMADPPYLVQWVLGAQNANYPTPMDLLSLIHLLPEQSLFSVIGIGAFSIPLAAVAIAMGGHVRVGMEDNVYFSRGEKAQSNAQLVDRIVRIATAMGRSIATPSEARAMLGISPTPTTYPPRVKAAGPDTATRAQTTAGGRNS